MSINANGSSEIRNVNRPQEPDLNKFIDRSADLLQYEDLYNQLFDRSVAMHEANRKRIKKGVGVLLLLPIVLCIIRWLTDSDKVVFLIIYIFCMFAISAYLISVEYLDDAIQKTLTDVTNKEADLGGLIMDAEELRERISEKHEERRTFILERRSTIWHPGRLTGVHAQAHPGEQSEAKMQPDEQVKHEEQMRPDAQVQPEKQAQSEKQIQPDAQAQLESASASSADTASPVAPNDFDIFLPEAISNLSDQGVLSDPAASTIKVKKGGEAKS